MATNLGVRGSNPFGRASLLDSLTTTSAPRPSGPAADPRPPSSERGGRRRAGRGCSLRRAGRESRRRRDEMSPPERLPLGDRRCPSDRIRRDVRSGSVPRRSPTSRHGRVPRVGPNSAALGTTADPRDPIAIPSKTGRPTRSGTLRTNRHVVSAVIARSAGEPVRRRSSGGSSPGSRRPRGSSAAR